MSLTRSTPVWSNPCHNTIRRACFKTLSLGCLKALKEGGLAGEATACAAQRLEGPGGTQPTTRR